MQSECEYPNLFVALQDAVQASGNSRVDMADIEELHERAEQAASDKRLASVTVSMAILAVFVAAVSLMGERIHANEVLAQTRAADQWAQYQAKVIRERSYEVFLDQLDVFAVQDASHAAQVKAKYKSEIDRYTSETKDISTQANSTESNVAVLDRRSNWFDFADVLLEASLVICSITLLTQKRGYWYFGLLGAASGIVVAIVGLFIR
jgi:uncharacterized protein DUF4337